MAGNSIGGTKAAQKNKQIHGEDFYKKIGAKGGRRGKTGGFASNPELARQAGAIGGRKSRRKSQYRDEIIALHKQGLSDRQIAKELGIAPPTVRKHLA